MSGNGDSCDSMQDSGDCNSMQDVEGETTVVDGAQDNGQNNNFDSCYGTLSNTPATSTETIFNDNDAPNDTMEVDDTIAVNDTMAVDNQMEIDAATNGGGTAAGTAPKSLTCDGCKHPYDDNTHVVLPGSCSHARCKACWKQSNCLCSVCNMYSENLRSHFPDEPTELIKTSNTMSKGVVVKSSPCQSSGAASTLTTKVKSNPNQPSSTGTSKGVLLKSPPNSNSSSGTASSLTVKSDQQSAKTAQVKIRCMNGKTLEETVPRSMTVNGMKKMVNEKTGISQERQHLLHKGKTMTDTRTLQSYSVQNGSTIQMAEKCYGG